MNGKFINNEIFGSTVGGGVLCEHDADEEWIGKQRETSNMSKSALDVGGFQLPSTACAQPQPNVMFRVFKIQSLMKIMNVKL